MARTTPTNSRLSSLAPLALVGVGVALLLNNFLLLGEVNLLTLAPLGLVALGAVVLLRGDIALNSETRRFSITRGSVESATLELNTGEMDLTLSALADSNQERLIVGYYASSARPELSVQHTHASIRMNRERLDWTSLSEWEARLTQGMPWDIYASSSTGQLTLDLSQLITRNVRIASGVGEIRMTAPQEQLEGGEIHLQSSLGNLHLFIPPHKGAEIYVHKGRFVNVHFDESRYQRTSQGYMTRFDDEHDDAPLSPPVVIHLSGTFSDIYLA